MVGVFYLLRKKKKDSPLYAFRDLESAAAFQVKKNEFNFQKLDHEIGSQPIIDITENGMYVVAIFDEVDPAVTLIELYFSYKLHFSYKGDSYVIDHILEIWDSDIHWTQYEKYFFATQEDRPKEIVEKLTAVCHWINCRQLDEIQDRLGKNANPLEICGRENYMKLVESVRKITVFDPQGI